MRGETRVSRTVNKLCVYILRPGKVCSFRERERERFCKYTYIGSYERVLLNAHYFVEKNKMYCNTFIKNYIYNYTLYVLKCLI